MNLVKLVFGLIMTTLACTATAEIQRFGTSIDIAALTPVSQIVAKPDQFLGKVITVQGRIQSVCTNKGCWMQLASDQAQQQFKIKVRDGDMVFPVSARGKTAYATGTLQKTELDLASTQEHFADIAEREQRAFDPATVTEPLVLLQLVPTGVEIRP